MRRIVLWLAATVTIVVLLFGYHTSTDKTAPVAVASSAPAPTTAGPSSSSAGPSASASGSSPASRTKTYPGSVAQTQWGPVQVEITVSGDTISDVTVLQQPDGNPRDTEINAYALPILIRDTLSKQSAQIDMVSGATVTSDGYVESLQAALDKAGK